MHVVCGFSFTMHESVLYTTIVSQVTCTLGVTSQRYSIQHGRIIDIIHITWASETIISAALWLLSSRHVMKTKVLLKHQHLYLFPLTGIKWYIAKTATGESHWNNISVNTAKVNWTVSVHKNKTRECNIYRATMPTGRTACTSSSSTLWIRARMYCYRCFWTGFGP